MKAVSDRKEGAPLRSQELTNNELLVADFRAHERTDTRGDPRRKSSVSISSVAAYEDRIEGKRYVAVTCAFRNSTPVFARPLLSRNNPPAAVPYLQPATVPRKSTTLP